MTKRFETHAKASPYVSLLALSAFYTVIFALVIHRVNFTPKALDLSAPHASFSEARAMRHLSSLSDPHGTVGGNRQVSTPGLDRATRYMVQAAHAIRAEVDRLVAEKGMNGPPLLTAEVQVETVSGSSTLDFTSPPIKINLTNVYLGLDNVALVLRPKRSSSGVQGKALLICSHYDGPIASYGAADDASQVSVMLEAARALVHLLLHPDSSQRRTLEAPVIFLWTGGEEPISPAAHGWMKNSPLAAEVGAFINLEAMGGGGMPILFQHTGSWTPRAWGSGAPHARGSRVAQDIFDANALPADSDYRMFSGRHYGSLPGIDVAFVFDSLVYHSYLDKPSRIKEGSLQEMGENLIGALFSFTEHLAKDQGSDDEDPFGRSIYFDFLGLFMISYSDSLAAHLHHSPLLLALVISSASIALSRRGGSGVRQTSLATGRMLLSVIMGVTFPALFGIVRASLPGCRPMIWYAHQWIGHLIFLPMGLLGALLPHLTVNQEEGIPDHRSSSTSLAMRGSGIAAGMIASILHLVGFPGISAIFGWSSLLSIAYSLLASFASAVPSCPTSVLVGLGAALAIVPVSIGSSVVVVFLRVIMERIGLLGDVNLWMADLIVGVLSGSAILASSCGVFLILIANVISNLGMRKTVVSSLLATSLLTAAYSSAYLHPYSILAPKRTVISHIHHVELVIPHKAHGEKYDGSLNGSDTIGDWCAASASLPPPCSTLSSDGLKVASSKFAIGGLDSNPISFAMPETEGGDTDDLLALDGRENSGFFPVHLLPKGFVFKSPPSSLLTGMSLPHICTLEDQASGNLEGKRLFELRIDRPAWVVLNVTTSIGWELDSWSFGHPLMPSKVHGSWGNEQHVARIMLQPPHNHTISFWTMARRRPHGEGQGSAGLNLNSNPLYTRDRPRVEEEGLPSCVIRAELSVSLLDLTDELMAARQRLPEWTSEVWLATVLQSSWEWPC